MKKITKFSAILKMAAVIAFAAIIGFAMIACDDVNGNTGGNDNGNDNEPGITPNGTQRYETVPYSGTPSSNRVASPSGSLIGRSLAPLTGDESYVEVYSGWSDNMTYQFVYYLGYVRFTPVTYREAVYYNGTTPISVTYTRQDLSAQNISDSMGKKVEYTIANTSIDYDSSYGFDAAGLSAGEISRIQAGITGKGLNISVTSTHSSVLSHVGETFSTSATIGTNNEGTGRYRYALFGTVDTFCLFDVNPITGEVISVNVISCARPASYAWGIDFAPGIDGAFGKTAEGDLLEVPDVDYTGIDFFADSETISVGANLRAIFAPVFNEDASTFFTYNGTLNLPPVGTNVFDADWDEDTPAGFNASIVNNRLSFNIGAVTGNYIGALNEMISSTPSGVNGAVIYAFGDYNIVTEEMHTVVLVNKNNIYEIIAFAFADRDAYIEGVDYSTYYNVFLKTGWNTIKFDFKSSVITSFTPDDDYIWMYNPPLFGSDSDWGSPGIDIGSFLTEISGFINVGLNSSFPAGGITLTANTYNGSVIGTVDFTSGTTSMPWTMINLTNLPEMLNHSWAQFNLLIYPDVGRNTVYRIRPQVLSYNGINEPIYIPEWDSTEDMLVRHEDVKFRDYFTTTRTVPVTLSGISGNVTISANNRPRVDEEYSNYYRMMVNGNGTYNFILPDDLGQNEFDENWLWFTVTTSTGVVYITKGLVRADTGTITLNTANMYILN